MVNLDIKFWGEKMKKIQFLVIAAILSFGLIISSAILSNMVEKVNKRERRYEKRRKRERGGVKKETGHNEKNTMKKVGSVRGE
mgnify:CR=1 FL=1